jgi:hypothetical protein
MEKGPIGDFGIQKILTIILSIIARDIQILLKFYLIWQSPIDIL